MDSYETKTNLDTRLQIKTTGDLITPHENVEIGVERFNIYLTNVKYFSTTTNDYIQVYHSGWNRTFRVYLENIDWYDFQEFVSYLQRKINKVWGAYLPFPTLLGEGSEEETTTVLEDETTTVLEDETTTILEEDEDEETDENGNELKFDSDGDGFVSFFEFLDSMYHGATGYNKLRLMPPRLLLEGSDINLYWSYDTMDTFRWGHIEDLVHFSVSPGLLERFFTMHLNPYHNNDWLHRRRIQDNFLFSTSVVDDLINQFRYKGHCFVTSVPFSQCSNIIEFDNLLIGAIGLNVEGTYLNSLSGLDNQATNETILIDVGISDVPNPYDLKNIRYNSGSSDIRFNKLTVTSKVDRFILTAKLKYKNGQIHNIQTKAGDHNNILLVVKLNN